MTQALLFALIRFAFVSSITPGPNNMMLMASGANFGLRRTLPHLLGVSLGFAVLATGIGLGLAQVFDAFPGVFDVLKWVCVGFLIYLAWKIATSAPITEGPKVSEPMTFLQACAFQWVNPKAVYMAITATTVYGGGTVAGVLMVAAVFTAVNLPCVGTWAVVGTQIRRLLSTPERFRAFNIVMAALLLTTIWPILKA